MSQTDKPTIFIYKMTTDDGGAPCVHGGIISLCLCKPGIRKTAKPGDWIIGVGGKSVRDLRDRLIYIMKIGKQVHGSKYYAPNSEYRDRPDCVYEWDESKYEWVDGSDYHCGLKDHDLGSPESKFSRAWCLVGSKFAYFGKKEIFIDKNTAIGRIYDNLPRNYRRNHSDRDYTTLHSYIDDILKKHGEGKHGCPTHKPKGTC